ncbi:hypothetical protein FACS1894122_13490 [Alphaproteobacteria bacterium]|nr:hypothetical protein FACS1894122_13490 [Alphaproteobacteria bacterium]
MIAALMLGLNVFNRRTVFMWGDFAEWPEISTFSTLKISVTRSESTYMNTITK